MKFSNLPRSGRAAVLLRVAGLGLIAAVVVGPVAANAAGADSSPLSLLDSVTSTVSGLLGGTAPAPAGPAANPASDSGYGYGAPGAGTSTTTSGGAIAVNSGSTTANSGGNTGAGNGNQVSGSVQAPIDVSCNSVGLLGYAAAPCPTATTPATVTTPPSGTTRSAPTTSVAGTTAAAPASTALPLTGSASEPIGIAGGTLLLVGGSLVWLTRPRRRARHSL